MTYLGPGRILGLLPRIRVATSKDVVLREHRFLAVPRVESAVVGWDVDLSLLLPIIVALDAALRIREALA